MTALDLLASGELELPPYRDQLEAAIRLVRAELGDKAQAKGPVWQEMRDRWAALVQRWKAVYGPLAALEGGKRPKGWLAAALDGPDTA